MTPFLLLSVSGTSLIIIANQNHKSWGVTNKLFHLYYLVKSRQNPDGDSSSQHSGKCSIHEFEYDQDIKAENDQPAKQCPVCDILR